MARKRKSTAPAESDKHPTDETPTATPTVDRLMKRMAEAEEHPNPFAIMEALGAAGLTNTELANILAGRGVPLEAKKDYALATDKELQQEVELEITEITTEARQQGYAGGRALFTKKPDHDRNENLVRLRDEVLPNGKRRTWKEICVEMKKINPTWVYKHDAARLQYRKIKKKRNQ